MRAAPLGSPIRPLDALLILLLISACSAQRPPAGDAVPQSAAAPTAAPGSAVTLHFAWPDGLRARVRTTSVKSQMIGPQSRTQDMVSTYSMTATRSERGTAVVFDEFEVDRPGANPDDQAVEMVLAYRPGFVVDEAGKLLELAGLEPLGRLLTELQERSTTSPDEVRQGLQAVAQTVSSEDYLKARASSDWSNLIGAWVGQTLTTGKVERTTEKTPPSGLVDQEIGTDVTVSVARIDACHRVQPRDCVRLRLTREPHPDQLREAMLPNLGKMLGVEDWGPEGAPELRDVTATSQLIVDAEPDTLVPHRVEAVRVFSLEMHRPSGALQVRDSNRVTSTFQYD